MDLLTIRCVTFKHVIYPVGYTVSIMKVGLGNLQSPFNSKILEPNEIPNLPSAFISSLSSTILAWSELLMSLQPDC